MPRVIPESAHWQAYVLAEYIVLYVDEFYDVGDRMLALVFEYVS